jgi:AcrR family transcriptional regulator
MRTSGAATRQRIVEAAYALFYKNGFAAASVDAVAEAAGITKRSFYYHFDSKQQLLGAVFEQQSKLVLAEIERWAGAKVSEPERIVERIFGEYAKWAKKPGWRSSGFTRAAMEFAASPGHPVRRAARQHKALIEEWFTARFAAGGIARAAELARQLMLLMEGCHSLILISGDASYTGTATNAARALIVAARH